MDSQALDPQVLVVRDANERFYRALSSLDLDLMDRVWLHGSFVRCIHPGWGILIGWRAIRTSWEQIFRNTEGHSVEPEDVHVQVEGGLGWVSCVERIVTRRGATLTAATNLFEISPGGEDCRMMLHHASILPADELESLGESEWIH